MIKKLTRFGPVILGMLGLLASAGSSLAQTFVANKGDLLACFRKTSGGSYELVVNIGNVTNFLAVPGGTTVSVSNFSPAQLTAAFPTYNNLQWSVNGSFNGSSPWAGFPASTIWSTQARASTNVQSTPPPRPNLATQQAAKARVVGVGTGAATNSINLGATNANNNLYLVREPAGDSSGLTAFIGDPSDTTVGNFQGTWYAVEGVIVGSFSAAQRSDLYQSVPDGGNDPTSGLTTGDAYYIGYFQFNPAGTMTFTRASSGAQPPPAPTISLQRTGNNTTISFPTANNATYTLLFTDAAGLGSPRSTWSTSSTNLIGDGNVRNFVDSTTNPNRFYSVVGH